MTTFYARSLHVFRAALWAVPLLALAWSAPGRADEQADFHAALEAATAQYHLAMSTLERSSQAQTAAEVRRFRQAWQAVIDHAGSNRPAAYATTEQFFGMLTQIDMRIVGVLLVIDLGNRDAARNALAPIEEILLRMQETAAPPE
jgi:hypothetical protein